MIACSREARHTGNLKLAGSLMTKLSKTQETASSTLSLRIERESAKQIMCLKNSNLALEKMLAVALQPVSSDSDKELNELVARLVSPRSAFILFCFHLILLHSSCLLKLLFFFYLNLLNVAVLSKFCQT